MKTNKFLAILLCLAFVVGVFGACAAKDGGDTPAATTAGSSDSGESSTPASFDSLPSKLTAKKVGSFSDKGYLTTEEGGITYQDSTKKYGIISPDGKSDTGAIYTAVDGIGKLFSVTTATATDITDPASMNCFGLVDATGKELLEAKYADFKVLNDRYYQVYEVTGTTDNKDEALIFGTERMIPGLSPEEGDVLYTGTWYIYDAKLNKLIDGVSGTNAYMNSAYGNYVEYVGDDGKRHIINGEGQNPGIEELYADGSYSIEDDTKKEVSIYDTDDKLLFTYSTEEYNTITDMSNAQYFATSSKKSDDNYYVLLDRSGKEVSAHFEDAITVEGDVIESGSKLYSFDGKQLLDGEYYISADKDFQCLYNLHSRTNDDEYAVMDKDGNILVSNKDDSTLDIDYFPLSKKTDDGDVFYSFKDKDFTLKGSSWGGSFWIIRADDGDTDSLIDVLSGETLLKDYDSYDASGELTTQLYIYATKDGNTDIYEIKAE